MFFAVCIVNNHIFEQKNRIFIQLLFHKFIVYFLFSLYSGHVCCWMDYFSPTLDTEYTVISIYPAQASENVRKHADMKRMVITCRY